MVAWPARPYMLRRMIHLVKLSVGSQSIETLADWQADPRCARVGGNPAHVTRMWPKREAELLDGGSIYWVIQGHIQARQTVLDLVEATGGDGIRRCAIVLDPQIIRVTPAVKRPFQGWRYLQPGDAPRDLGPFQPGEDALPADLEASLAEIGVL